jgi:hypothetical protein
MLLSDISILVVALLSSEVPEGLVNCSVLVSSHLNLDAWTETDGNVRFLNMALFFAL